MNNGHSALAPPTPALVFEMLQAHQRTAALKAAIDLDIFRAVGEGPGDVASIARHCAASERGIRILCDFLTINGILAKEDGHYRHTPTSAAFLDPRSPSGGRAATLELVPNEDRVSPPMPAAFAMTMLTSTPAGDAYPLSHLTAMYNEAGFGNITAHPIPMSPHTVVMGHA